MKRKNRTKLARNPARFGCLVRVLSGFGIDSILGTITKCMCAEVVDRMIAAKCGHDPEYLRSFIVVNRLLLFYLIVDVGISSATNIEIGKHAVQLRKTWMERKLSCRNLTDWPIEAQQEVFEMCKARHVNVDKFFGKIKENIQRVQAVQESNGEIAPKIENIPLKEEKS